MSGHRQFCAEEAVRRRMHIPEVLLKDIGLKAGAVFMDIGCGEGFFTIPAAEIVGAGGRVYAVDSDASAIDRLKSKVAEKGLNNVVAKVRIAEEMVFCKECADFVFYSMVLHDFGDPEKVLLNARQMIKSTGRLVNLDWKKKRSLFGPPVRIRFSEVEAQSLIEAAGFKIVSVKDSGQDHYIVVAKP